MPRTLVFEYRYPVAPDRLFALLTDLDTLEAAGWPWLRYHHLPSGPVRCGQVIDLALSPFGLLPEWPYRIEVRCCDSAARRMLWHERGLGLRALVHDVTVSQDPAGARLSERVEVDAGWLTPVAAICARFHYRWRHRTRLRLLGLA